MPTLFSANRSKPLERVDKKYKIDTEYRAANKPAKFTALILASCLLAACSSQGPQKLGELKYKAKKEKKIEFKKLSHNEVRNEYKEILDLFEDKQLKEQIERRIADVYMMEGNFDANRDAPRKSYYVEAIKEYEEILKKYPNSPDNAEVLYQLAKAYDLEGDQEKAMTMLTDLVRRHPNYPNIAEAHFRRGDIQFNSGQYTEAERSYYQVIQKGNERLKINAYYMLAWSQYKLFKFDSSVKNYSVVFASLLGEQTTLDALTSTERPVVEDTIHSMSLAFDKLGGAQSIEDYASIANLPSTWLLYDELGQYYLDKKLYEESAVSYRTFIQRFPKDRRSPTLHANIITAYIKGEFPQQALEEKETYVASYGIYSDFPANANGLSDELSPTIQTYLDELSGHYHGAGQVYDKEAAKLASSKSKAAKKRTLAKEAYLKATAFYQEFIDSFPSHASVDAKRFRRAEAFFAADDYQNAITDYELVAYTPVGTSAEAQAADAGYAAIFSYQKLLDAEKKDKASRELKAKAVDSMLRFSGKFDSDERSPNVLTNAAEYLYGLDRYDRALEVAESLIADNPNLASEVKRTAYGIAALSAFKLEQFAKARDAYLAQRELTPANTEEYGAITERVATAAYKHGESLLAAQKPDEAIAQYLDIKQLAPASPVRIVAQYDAASLLLSQEQYKQALPELLDFDRNFPSHELAADVKRKLAFAYEKDEQWESAAKRYSYLAQNDADADIRRDSLYSSADMYEKAKDPYRAIAQYEAFNSQYREPFDLVLEARHRLAENYKALNNTKQEHAWLEQIIALDKQAGANSTTRSRFLASSAHMTFGDYYAKRYEYVYLKQPLAESMEEKSAALDIAAAHYQDAASLGALEFVTQSSYKIAGLYEAFAKGLRRAPRPQGLAGDDIRLYYEIIEEQALPFDELARELHLANITRAWEGQYHEWIGKSFEAMQVLEPERFAKQARTTDFGEGLL